MTPPGRATAAIGRIDLAVLLGLLILAAALRLPDLATRAPWDADQGRDMLLLRAFVRDGVIPLLGAPTSIGDVHHGVGFYYLLAPVAWLTGGDSPLAVTLEIALFGIAGVAVTWWLARSIGGPTAGAVAGLVMAVSASAVASSTFIWNPNLIACTSAIALSGTWRAWTTGRARWWLLAALGATLTIQCHLIAVVLLPVIGAVFLADLRRRKDGAARRATIAAGLGGLAILALSFLPLAIHELMTAGGELRALLEYLAQGGDGAAPNLPVRSLIILVRVVGWPLGGVITDASLPVALSTIAVLAIVAWRWGSPDAHERWAVRWLGTGLLWTSVSLAVVAPSLAIVVPGLPNDHYHAFDDPMVFVLVGLGAAAAARAGRRTLTIAGRRAAVGVVATIAGVAALVFWNVGHEPPSVAPDGNVVQAEAAAARIVAAAGDRPLALRSVPDFKTADAIGYPLMLAGRPGVPVADARAVAVVCDPLFEPTVGQPCGGPAEDTSLRDQLDAGTLRLVERFTASPRQVISVYAEP